MTVSKDEILAVNEAAARTDTKKETKFGLSVFTGAWKKISSLNLKENHNQRKTIVNSWVRCLENNQLVITSAFPTVNFRK